MNVVYKVTGRRQVPMDAEHHCGETAICVKTAAGFMAWGFGLSDREAEYRAVAAVQALEDSTPDDADLVQGAQMPT